MDVLHGQLSVLESPGPQLLADQLVVAQTPMNAEAASVPPGPPGPPSGTEAGSLGDDGGYVPGYDPEVIGITPDGHPIYGGAAEARSQELLYIIPLPSDDDNTTARRPIRGPEDDPDAGAGRVHLEAASLRENRWPDDLRNHTLGLLAVGLPMRENIAKMIEMGAPHHVVGRILAGLGDVAMAPLVNYLLGGDRVSRLTPWDMDVTQRPEFDLDPTTAR